MYTIRRTDRDLGIAQFPMTRFRSFVRMFLFIGGSQFHKFILAFFEMNCEKQNQFFGCFIYNIGTLDVSEIMVFPISIYAGPEISSQTPCEHPKSPKK